MIQDGYNADSLHGELSQAQRDLTMSKFRQHHIQLLVATDVAARGLDVADLINDVNLVPRYYDKVGYSSGILEQQRRIQDDRWDFAVQPDAVVINLGTNDASYTWDFRSFSRCSRRHMRSSCIPCVKKIRMR